MFVTSAFGQDRTADGQPNIQGVWTNFAPTPFEAPNDIDLERLAPLAAWFPGTNRPQRPPARPSPGARSQGPRGPWGDGPGDALRNERRRSMIVETANYNDQGTIGTNIASRGLRGIQQSEALKIVERFTRVDADTVDYDVTIDDPGPFTAPWRVAMPLNRDRGYQIYEYACHEGNYGLENSLRAGRADDRAVAP